MATALVSCRLGVVLLMALLQELLAAAMVVRLIEWSPAHHNRAADDPLALEQQVCFALAVASRTVISVYRPVLEPLGLTHPQYLVMLALWGAEPLSLTELSRMLELDAGTLSRLFKRLRLQVSYAATATRPTSGAWPSRSRRGVARCVSRRSPSPARSSTDSTWTSPTWSSSVTA